MRIRRHRSSIILRLNTISLVVFAWSVVALPPGLCAAADERGNPFVVYAVDGSDEQLLHVTVRASGNRVQVLQEGVLAMPGKPRGIAKHPTQPSIIVTLLGKGAESPRAVTIGNNGAGNLSIVGVSELQDSTGYTSLDRTGGYFLTSSYHDGHFDAVSYTHLTLPTKA